MPTAAALTHRYRKLSHAALSESVQNLGLEAEHLERLYERVSDWLEDRLLDDLIVEETLNFLTLLLQVNRSLPALTPTALPAGLTALPDEDVRVQEPAVAVGSPGIDR